MNREQMIIKAALAEAERLRQLHGSPKQINLAVYASDSDLRQLRPEDGPDATARQQRGMVDQIASSLREQGFSVNLITMQASDYLKWISDLGLENNAANRAKFISLKSS